jgi:predicted membrane protein
MFKIAAVLFAIAALGGLTLAVMHFRAHGKTPPPTSLAMLHGLLAVIAVICLIFGIAATPNGFSAGFASMAVTALGLFVLAALGGAYMFLGKHLRGEPLPTPVVIIHGLAAVAVSCSCSSTCSALQ